MSYRIEEEKGQFKVLDKGATSIIVLERCATQQEAEHCIK